jgi:hypothetical protein
MTRHAYLASGNTERLVEAIFKESEHLWNNLDLHYCPKMAVMDRLVESALKLLVTT